MRGGRRSRRTHTEFSWSFGELRLRSKLGEKSASPLLTVEDIPVLTVNQGLSRFQQVSSAELTAKIVKGEEDGIYENAVAQIDRVRVPPMAEYEYEYHFIEYEYEARRELWVMPRHQFNGYKPTFHLPSRKRFIKPVKISAFVDRLDFTQLYSFAGELPSPIHPS